MRAIICTSRSTARKLPRRENSTASQHMMGAGLFPHFAGLWVALCPARAVPRGRPLSLMLAGERLVLFRDTHGAVQALLDRCPHRGVALSLGRVAEGLITCPFHGWRFDGAGQCRHVPWNPDAKLATLSATALPLREIAGLIWLYTGGTAMGGPAMPETLLRQDIRVTAQDFTWNAHWTRVMENMLDTPHLPFVHAKTIGRHLRGRSSAAMEMRWQETAYGADITARRAGEAPRPGLRYYFPNIMELTIDPAGRVMRLLAVCNPAEEGKTRLTIYTLRNFAKLKLLDPLFLRANARIAAEDRAIVESAQPAEAPPAGEEKSVATDAPTLAFRKLWFERIKGGAA